MVGNRQPRAASLDACCVRRRCHATSGAGRHCTHTNQIDIGIKQVQRGVVAAVGTGQPRADDAAPLPQLASAGPGGGLNRSATSTAGTPTSPTAPTEPASTNLPQFVPLLRMTTGPPVLSPSAQLGELSHADRPKIKTTDHRRALRWRAPHRSSVTMSIVQPELHDRRKRLSP
jgi:hypothetical protein